MSEFIRRKRFLNYFDSNCKKYIRKDFLQICAYCKIREADLGGPDGFQIDHFKPKNGVKIKNELDSYGNLYYSCASCNGRGGKTNYWSPTLLDPCKEKIYGVHISGKPDENYFFEPISPQGVEFINAIKLNKKSKLKIRKEVSERAKILIERNEILKTSLNQLLNCGNLSSDTIIELQNVITENRFLIENGIKFVPNQYFFDEEHECKIINCLKSNYEVELIDEDYDLHIQCSNKSCKFKAHIVIQDELNFRDGKCNKRISSEQIDIWRKDETPIVMLFFCKKTDNLYYINFTNEFDNSTLNAKLQCTLQILVDNNIEKGILNNFEI